MTQQTKNSLGLYRGGNPDTIYQLMRVQPSKVRDELMEICHTNDLKECALRLSIGAY